MVLGDFDVFSMLSEHSFDVQSGSETYRFHSAERYMAAMKAKSTKDYDLLEDAMSLDKRANGMRSRVFDKSLESAESWQTNYRETYS